MPSRLPESAVTAAVLLAVSFAFAQSDLQVLVNNVGYEAGGPKRAVVQSSSAIAATSASLVDAVGGNVVGPVVTLGAQENVAGWSGRNFKVAEFSSFATEGTYRIRVGTAVSPVFSIGTKILQAKTGADQVNFFNGMRSDDDRDKNLPIFGSDGRRNIYGGWWDANGDPGKHISHLSYANYYNPQQIPLVVWALLHASDLQPEAFGADAKAEAAWGADYLLRALAPQGYFYMSVFDNWGDEYTYMPAAPGSKGGREICAWSHSEGVRSGDYQCAMREGGGVSIAALARAFKAGISGDSSAARYLAGAKRAYDHLKANPLAYQDDGKENIIDDYCGLLAATELYNATGEETYRGDARARAASLLGRQDPQGWFYSGKDDNGANIRPFYHAADEGFPVVALSRYYDVIKANDGTAQGLNDVRYAVGKNLRWYRDISRNYGANPFEYVKMYRAASGGGGVTGGNLARNRPATASRAEGSHTADKAFDGAVGDASRWSSYLSGAQNDSQWISVELDDVYKVNRVVLNWEAAYGKQYRIDVSLNGTSWTTALEIPNNGSGGIKEHVINPVVNAKYVRMFGITRGFEHGGFSLYEFEVYGELASPPPTPSPYQAGYFVPHENETGYWWQGENARLASMSAAFIMGAPVADNGATLWKDTLFNMATAQLDWILGKNPFEVCMMEGHGANTYPAYPAGKNAKIRGGICNGITAQDSDENDIQWMADPSAEVWQNWRWIEQWLPHNAWYLTAVSALSYRIDNELTDDPIVSVKHGASAKSNKLKISAVKGMGLRITLPFAANDKTEVSVYSIQGKKVYTNKIQRGLRAVSMRLPSTVARGTYVVDIKDAEGKNKAFGKVIFR
jgi:hypothetical protein